MIPLIIASYDQKGIDDFLQKLIEQNKIAKSNVFRVYPEGKEFLIRQIKEIKKNIIFEIQKPQLYILYDFDNASFEAQNAFLKTLEEHNSNLQFILVVRNHNRLLPTILSRSKLQILKIDEPPTTEKLEFKTLGDFTLSPDLNPEEKLDQMLYFFHNKLAENKNSPKILREILNVRHLLINNNLNPQLALDHLFIFISLTSSF